MMLIDGLKSSFESKYEEVYSSRYSGGGKFFTQIFEYDSCSTRIHTQQFGCYLELLQKTVH